MIAKDDLADWSTEYDLRLDFLNECILLSAKWEVDANLIKEVLDWLHGLTFKIRFIISDEYLRARKVSMNEWISLVWNGSGLLFYWSTVSFLFNWEIEDKMEDMDSMYFEELFRQIMLIDWGVFVENLIINSLDIWEIILNWMVS